MFSHNFDVNIKVGVLPSNIWKTVKKEKQIKLPKNPLVGLWNIFSILSGILGLASIVEDFTKWQGYIETIISAYRNIVHPVFELLFSWVWFMIPTIFYDYMVIGLLVTISFLRALYAADEVEGYRIGLIPSQFWGENPLFVTGTLAARLAFWPLIIIFYLYRCLSGFDESKVESSWKDYYTRRPQTESLAISVRRMVKYEFARYTEGIRFFQWLGVVSFGLILLLAVNQFL